MRVAFDPREHILYVVETPDEARAEIESRRPVHGPLARALLHDRQPRAKSLMSNLDVMMSDRRTAIRQAQELRSTRRCFSDAC